MIIDDDRWLIVFNVGVSDVVLEKVGAGIVQAAEVADKKVLLAVQSPCVVNQLQGFLTYIISLFTWVADGFLMCFNMTVNVFLGLS